MYLVTDCPFLLWLWSGFPVYADWQIAEEAEKTLPSVDYFREKLGLLPEEIIPYGKTPKIDFIKVMNRLKDKPDGKFIEVTAATPGPCGSRLTLDSLNTSEMCPLYFIPFPFVLPLMVSQ